MVQTKIFYVIFNSYFYFQKKIKLDEPYKVSPTPKLLNTFAIIVFLCYIIKLAASYMHQHILQVTSFFPKELLAFTVDLTLNL